MQILSDVRNNSGTPVVSDFAHADDAPILSEVCDFIQIPAYLCRKTHVLPAVAQTKRPIHLKKGAVYEPLEYEK